jgi:hypothetical protein
MTRCWNHRSSDTRPKVRRAVARLVATSCALLIASTALAQGPQPEPRGEPEPPTSRPGLVETLGRWFGDSKARIDEQLKSTTDAAKGAADAAKGAADAAGQATGAILGLPGTRVAIGRERCAVAPNGAPDCAAAADALCRSKGLGPGKSVEINTAQKCPTWVWLSGRPAPEGVCVTETFVLRAMCR